MSEEVRVVNEKTGGAKGSKDERFDLIPYDALAEIAKVYGMGAKKYDPHNWRKGYDWGLSYAALMRHITAFWNGEDLDPESGLPHVAHAGWHCLTLLTFMKEHQDLDDRYTTVQARKASEALADALKHAQSSVPVTQPPFQSMNLDDNPTQLLPVATELD